MGHIVVVVVWIWIYVNMYMYVYMYQYVRVYVCIYVYMYYDYHYYFLKISYVLLDHCFEDPLNRDGHFLAHSMLSTLVRNADMIIFLFRLLKKVLYRELRYYVRFFMTLIIFL